MVTIIIALIITIILTAISLFFIYFLLRRAKATHAKKLFYFDLFRLILKFSVIQFLVFPILYGSLPNRIFNSQNLSLPPPGVASVQDWLMWWFGFPLLEFSQSEAAIWADLSLILLHRTAAFLIPIALVVLTAMDYLWSYRNLKFAKYIRLFNYSIWLLGMIVWTSYALLINPNFPGAQDYRNKWMFMQYWGFAPWVVAIVVFGLIFSVWTTTVVIGYLIYKAWKE